MTKDEEDYILWIKSLPCGVCEASGPSDAHHVTDSGRRVSHYLTLPLCKDCHQGGQNGFHGNKFMWLVMKVTELVLLAVIIKKLWGMRKK